MDRPYFYHYCNTFGSPLAVFRDIPFFMGRWGRLVSGILDHAPAPEAGVVPTMLPRRIEGPITDDTVVWGNVEKYQHLRLVGRDIIDSELIGRSFSRAEIIDTQCDGIRVWSGQWQDCVLLAVSARSADIVKLELSDVRMMHVALWGSTWQKSTMEWCWLREVDLSGSSFTDCCFSDSVFYTVDLTDVSWKKCTFIDVDFRSAYVRTPEGIRLPMTQKRFKTMAPDSPHRACAFAEEGDQIHRSGATEAIPEAFRLCRKQSRPRQDVPLP